MLKIFQYFILFLIFLSLDCQSRQSSQMLSHPSIMLTQKTLPAIRKGILLYPLLGNSYNKVKKMADAAIIKPIDVPTPKDGAGGITHEQHKKNYQNLLACGIAYQISQDPKYAKYVQDVLLEYAKKYQTWPLHPKRKNAQEAGRIFWQNLNDCVWQVYVIQAYDLVFAALSPENRKIIENNLFKPIIKFLTIDATKTFNSIHNHGIWSSAAVGMTGYILGNKDWVAMALSGSKIDKKSGFLRQIDILLSPDGYYTEGPYYQRYAILPIILFAKTIQAYQPSLKIYEYKNSVLKKAIQTILQLTYTNGAFFPINDSIKNKTIKTEELVYGIDIAYAEMGKEANLLDVAEKQKRVIVSYDGLTVAAAIYANKIKPFIYKNIRINDGPNGNEGGLGILRAGKISDQQCVLLKATMKKMGHGHFDRLNMLYYDNGGEIFSDYGAARFLNIESKQGGDYLPENIAYAKQTIAHNTLVVDEASNFNGTLREEIKYSPDLIHFNSSSNLHIVSAKEEHAYKNVAYTRTLILMKVDGIKKPLLIDVLKVTSSKPHQYDLPYWYQGQLIDIPFPLILNTQQLKPLGKSAGYQYLWLNGINTFLQNGFAFVTFIKKNRFYTTSFLTDKNTSLEFVTLGANDPKFNLRNEKAFILSHKNTANQTFISITESHGNINPVTETIVGTASGINKLQITNDTDQQTAFLFSVKNKNYLVKLTYRNKNNFVTVIA